MTWLFSLTHVWMAIVSQSEFSILQKGWTETDLFTQNLGELFEIIFERDYSEDPKHLYRESMDLKRLNELSSLVLNKGTHKSIEVRSIWRCSDGISRIKHKLARMTKSVCFFEDYSLIPKLIFENYHQVKPFKHTNRREKRE